METQTQALNNLITLDHVTSNEVAVTQLSEEQQAKANAELLQAYLSAKKIELLILVQRRSNKLVTLQTK